MANQAKTRVPSAAANGKKGHTLISDAKFQQLYELTLLLQTASECGNLAASASSRGGAALAGLMADLRSGDAVIAASASADRGMSDFLRSRLPAIRFPSAMTITDLIVESLSNSTVDRLRRNGRVTVIFAPATGADPILAEARTLASAGRLPVLFVEEARRKNAASAPAGDGNALPTIPVDASDVIAMYRVAHESITRARQGSGPTQIVCTRWQPSDGSRNAAKVDSIQRLEQWLVARGLPVHQWREAIKAEWRNSAGNRASEAAGWFAGNGAGTARAQLFAGNNIEQVND